MTPIDVSKIRGLLTHNDAEYQRQGLELARSFGDFSRIFKGCMVRDGVLFFPTSTHDHAEPELGDYELNPSIIAGALESGAVDPLAVSSLVLPASATQADLDLCTHLPNLKKLSLAGCSGLSNLDALSTVTQLSELDLTGCHQITNTDGVLPIHQRLLVYFISDPKRLPPAVAALNNVLVEIKARSFGTDYCYEAFYLKDYDVIINHLTCGKAWADLWWPSCEHLFRDLACGGVDHAEVEVTDTRSNYGELDDLPETLALNKDFIKLLNDNYDGELLDYCYDHGQDPWTAGLATERLKPLPESHYDPDRVPIFELSMTFSDGRTWTYDQVDGSTCDQIQRQVGALSDAAPI